MTGAFPWNPLVAEPPPRLDFLDGFIGFHALASYILSIIWGLRNSTCTMLNEVERWRKSSGSVGIAPPACVLSSPIRKLTGELRSNYFHATLQVQGPALVKLPCCMPVYDFIP